MFFVAILRFSFFGHPVGAQQQSSNEFTNRQINQPINLSTNQSLTQIINQSIDQSTNQSTNQSINQSISQSSKQSINQSIDQSINRSNDHSINRSIDQSINRSINHLALLLPVHALLPPLSLHMGGGHGTRHWKHIAPVTHAMHGRLYIHLVIVEKLWVTRAFASQG